ncbi:MAG TPA: response regulator [Myxococcota bacterium]|nr:response regulator [Myxococcota bacterium]
MDVRKETITLAVTCSLAASALSIGIIAWHTRSQAQAAHASELADLEGHLRAAVELARAEMVDGLDRIDALPTEARFTAPRGRAVVAGLYDPAEHTWDDRLDARSGPTLPAWLPKFAESTPKGETRVAWLATPEGPVLAASRQAAQVEVWAQAADDALAGQLTRLTGSDLRLTAWASDTTDWPDEIVSELIDGGRVRASLRLFDEATQPIAELTVQSARIAHGDPLAEILPIVIGTVLIGLAGVAWSLSLVERQHFQPLERLAAQLRRVRGAQPTRLKPSGAAELDALLAPYNELIEQIDLARASADGLRRELDQERLDRRSLLDTMSREVRSVTGSVAASIELLAQEPSAPPHLLNIARQAVTTARDLGDHLYDLDAAPGAGAQVCPVDLPGLIDEVIVPLRARAEARDLRLLGPETGGLPRRVVADARRLRHLIDTLVGNRIDQPGRRLISLATTWTEAGSLRLSLEEDPLSTMGGAADPTVPLAMTRRLVEALRGTIRERQRPDGGLAVVVEIPVEATTPPPAFDEPIDDEPTSPGRRRVLLVDDNPVNLMVAENTLQGGGYVVLRATSGHDALRLQATQSFDLVLMDIAMPGLDGVQTCTQWRERERGPRVPILALTAMVSSHDVARCRAAGMDGFIAKPFRTHELLEVVATALARAPARVAQTQAQPILAR